MEKFSLFDFIAFIIPGGSTIILLYWTAINCTLFRITPLGLPDSLLLTGVLMVAFFLGLVISYLGERLENIFNGLPKSWHEILVKNNTLATNLDEICFKLFGYNFITESEGKIQIDVNKSGSFYNSAFYLLQTQGKSDKIQVLQSQYVFFRNSAALCFISFLCCISVFFVNLHSNLEVRNFALVGTFGAIVFFFIARQMSFKRRYYKMTNTLHTFYAFYISETKLKQPNM